MRTGLGLLRLLPAAVSAIVAAAGAALPVVLGAAEQDTASSAKLELGRKVFVQIAQPQCGVCHTLADAGTTGEIGAKLEEIVPDGQRVMAAVRQGVGVMPSYKETLTQAQIEAVAYYVAWAVRRVK